MMLTTARLTLTAFEENDAMFVFELLNDPGWLKNIGDRNIRSLEDARDYIVQKFRPGLWLIAKTDGGAPVGLGGLVTGRDGLDCPDIGYAVIDRASGQGYATEIAQAVLQHVRETMDVGRLGAITTLDNIPSQRVLLKCGFKFVDRRVLPAAGERAYYELV